MNARALAVMFGLACLSSACLLAAYDRWVRQPRTPQLAVLDIAGIYAQKARELLKAAPASGSDAYRQAVTADAEKFNAAVLQTTQEIARECRCVLLARPAVVEGVPLPDYTDLAQRRLGL